MVAYFSSLCCLQVERGHLPVEANGLHSCRLLLGQCQKVSLLLVLQKQFVLHHLLLHLFLCCVDRDIPEGPLMTEITQLLPS